jgi:uncharacterized protein
MQIRLQELATMPDYRARFDYTIDLSKEEVGFEFPFRQPVRLEGEVSDDAGAITLSATVYAHVTTRCARCGKPVEYDKETDVEFLLVKELEGEEEDLRDDVYLVESDVVELDDILIPELILDMEMAVVCDEDCKGLCPKCGKNLNQGECGCVVKEVDPRLAVLQKFLDSTK